MLFFVAHIPWRQSGTFKNNERGKLVGGDRGRLHDAPELGGLCIEIAAAGGPSGEQKSAHASNKVCTNAWHERNKYFTHTQQKKHDSEKELA